MNRIIFLLCIAFVIFSVHEVTGQVQQANEFLFDVTSVINNEAQADDQRLAMRLLSRSLEAQGGVQSENEGWLFMIGVSEEDESGRVALSISMYEKLPETIVELG